MLRERIYHLFAHRNNFAVWINGDALELPNTKPIELRDKKNFTLVGNILRELKLDPPRARVHEILAEFCEDIPFARAAGTPLAIYVRREDERELKKVLRSSRKKIINKFVPLGISYLS